MAESFRFDITDPEFVRDPFSTYARGRVEAPVHRHTGLPLVSIFRYDDVVSILGDAGAWSSRRNDPGAEQLGLPEPEKGTESLLGLDPPEHDRLRNFVNRAFTPRRVAPLESRVREIARELLDEALEKRTVDLVEAYSYPLPVIVIAELMGIPAEDRQKFRRWSDKVAENLGEGAGGTGIDQEAAKERLSISQEMDAYFGELLDERKLKPRSDIISHLVSTEREGDCMSRVEMLTMLRVMLIAGNETTRNLIGNAVVQLCRHPDELERLRGDPSLMPLAVNEVLRFDGSVQATTRNATRDVEMRGEKIAKGEQVITWLGSANRDENHFPEPDRFDVGRTPNHHVSFGFGVHFCMGSHLARLEARVALEELLRRTRSFGCVDDGPVQYTRSFILRGPTSLPVELVRLAGGVKT